MCSIGEDDFGDDGGVHVMKIEKLEITPTNEICRNCNESKAVVKLPYKEAQCSNCFLIYARHKFRATLGSSKVLPKDSNVAVYFNGSAKGAVLLDMLHYAQTQNTFKRLHCNLKVIYVDETFLHGNRNVDKIKHIQEILRNYSFDKYYSSLASFDAPINFNDLELIEKVTEAESKLNITFNEIKSLTSKQDFIHNLRKNKLRSAAQYIGCKFIFLPDISSDLATTLLSNISLGRGASTALDVSFMDDRLSEITLVRPLKDLSEIEINHYAELNNLNFIEVYDFGEEESPAYSIQNLTKSFIKNLQTNYSSTVSTIFRTGSKISAKKQIENGLDTDTKSEKQICKFCHSSLDCAFSNTLDAIEFSRLVSQNSVNNLDQEKCMQKEIHQTESSGFCVRNICHGCQNIFYDSSNNISEYLIPDS